jgi:hypothetical protein
MRSRLPRLSVGLAGTAHGLLLGAAYRKFGRLRSAFPLLRKWDCDAARSCRDLEVLCEVAWMGRLPLGEAGLCGSDRRETSSVFHNSENALADTPRRQNG